MTSSRRDFLRALSLGTGAILVGQGWYKPGRGVIVPPDPDRLLADGTLMWDLSNQVWYARVRGRWVAMEESRLGPAESRSIVLRGARDERHTYTGVIGYRI